MQSAQGDEGESGTTDGRPELTSGGTPPYAVMQAGPEAATPVPSGDTLVALLEQRAESAPHETLYIFLADRDGAEVRLTYAQVRERAKSIAVHLRDRGVRADCPILLLFHPGIDYICAFFGCLYAGAIPVPAYPPTHVRHLPRLQSILEDADTDFALTTRKELNGIESLAKSTRGIAIRCWLVLEEIDSPGDGWTDPQLDPSRVALLQYTSGSTSSPKGVMVTHRNLLTNIELLAWKTATVPGEVFVFWLPPYHDFGLIGGILAPLVVGATCVLMQPRSFLLNPYRWLRAIHEYRATLTGAPNFAYDLCVRSVTAAQRASLDLSCLRIAFNGAEPIRVKTLDEFSRAFGPCGFRPTAWLAAYGLAEATLMVSGQRLAPSQQPPAHAVFSRSALQSNRVAIPAAGEDQLALASTGRVLPEHRVAIVDPVTLQPCEPDQVGEVWVTGPCVAKGYWRRPEETQRAFCAALAGSSGERYLRTGDLGFVRNEELYICGRIKDVIIAHGMNIHPQDVEHASCESHRCLRENGASAFALEYEDAQRLVIVQELDFRQAPDDAVFGSIASAVLSSVGIAPDIIVLVKAGHLPRTSSGKIRRHQCKEEFENGSLSVIRRWERPRAPQAPADPGAMAPHTEVKHPAAASAADIETWLRTELALLSGLDAHSIDRDQPFAAYGLDSIAAVRLAEALSAGLERPVVPTVFWDHPTIAQLAGALAGETREVITAVPPQPVRGSGEAAEPIALVGLGCRFPGAHGAQEFWELLHRGGDAIRQAPAERYGAQSFSDTNSSPSCVRRGGFLDQVDQFDAQFFGISPVEAERMDPQQRLVLETAWEALEDAGIAASQLAGSLTGVFIGISTRDYDSVQRHAADGPSVYSATGSAGSIAANRLSYLLDLRGPSLAIDTACSSSLVAVHMACQSLRNGECGWALTGGVNLILSTQSSLPFAQAGMLAPDGLCKAFDASADGYVRGEGCGVVVLRRLSDALREGDRVRAVILGSSVMQDGRSNGLIAPNGTAQAAVIRQALAQAKLTPAQIGYVEAHGTGTALGDPIELNALKGVFSAEPAGARPCPVGSVKTNVGHLEAAAGIAGLIKAVLALEHRMIPAHLHYRIPNPHCSLAGTRMMIPDRLLPWDCAADRRTAGVSSFGFGGTLAHVVVTEAPSRSEPGPAWPRHLLTLSAKAAPALEAMTDRLAARLQASADLELPDIAYTLQVGRNAFGLRRMLVCGDRDQAIGALRSRDPLQLLTARVKNRPLDVAFMFPGQGAQKLRMAQELYREIAPFRATVDACARILKRHLSVDLLSLIYPEEEAAADKHTMLNQTQFAQPALFVVEYALARLWIGWGVRPWAMIGHSIGEYVAACLAGVFCLEDALALVAARGRLMQSLPAGAMLSVALDEEPLLAYLDDSICLAAVNGPQRCVVSGPATEVARLEQRLEERGISCRRVTTSHAFHSHMMEPVVADFAERVSAVKLRPPTIPFVSNVTGTWITAAEAGDPGYWARHLRAPVRFGVGLTRLAGEQDRDRVLIEVGPGQTLCALARLQRNATADMAWEALPSLSAGDKSATDLAVLLGTAGRLWLAGHPIDWRALNAGQTRRAVGLPTYSFQRERHWIQRPELALSQQQSSPVPQTDPGGWTEPTSALERLMIQQLEVMSQQLEVSSRSASRQLVAHPGRPTSAGVQPLRSVVSAGGAIRPAPPAEEPVRLPAVAGDGSNDRVFPLTTTQRGIWLECQLDAEAALSYQLTVALRLHGALDSARLLQAFQQIVDRHASLRTVIDADGALQRVRPQWTFDLPVTDFAHLADAGPGIERWIIENNHQPMDLSQGPLFHAHLLRTGSDEHVLTLTLHHLVTDGLSQELLVQELAICYSAACQLRVPTLPAAQPFSAYVLRQQDYLRSHRFEQDRAYWLRTLGSDLPPPLELPGGGQRRRQTSYRARQQNLTISGAVHAQLQRLGHQHGCTMFMTLFAAVAVLLGRCANQEEVVIGIPMTAGREATGESNLLGCTLNLVPVRCRSGGQPSFSGHLAEIRQRLLEAYAHADLPFADVLRELHLPRDRGRPLAAILFNLNRSLTLPQFAGLTGSLQACPVSFNTSDLVIDVTQLPERLEVAFRYRDEVFEHAAIARLAGHFIRLLEGIVADPSCRIDALPLLSEAERHQVLVEWNRTEAVDDRPATLHELFEKQVERTPQAVAIVFEGRELRYGELNARANRLAHHLRSLGVGPDALVGLCVPRSIDMVVGLLGILKAGGAYVPLDPNEPPERLAYMLSDARVGLLVSAAGLAGPVAHGGTRVVVLDSDQEAFGQYPHTAPDAGTRPDNLAYVLYTSGSTGRPKGVLVEHRQIVNYIRGLRQRVRLEDIRSYLMVQPLTVDSSVTVLYGSLLLGGVLHIASYETSLDAGLLADYTARHPVDCLKIAPPHLQALTQSPAQHSILPRKLLIVGGDVSHWEWMERIAQVNPGCRILNHYGPTEASVGVTAYPVGNGGERGATGAVPIGRPFGNARLYILDRRLEAVPIGVAGELYIGGVPVVRGYLGRPGLTAERFIPDPFATGERLYRTGDQARFLAGGNIEFLGRADDQVKIRGHRVELDEIANVLMEHAAVRQAVVVVAGTDVRQPYLAAYVVLTHDSAPAPGALRRYLGDRLPHYMVPATVTAVDALPRTPHGKLDRKALPAPDLSGSEAGYVAPRTPTEQLLADIWAGLLERDTVGVHDNFFELGGHSLLATRVTSKIPEVFGVDLPLRVVFEAPTVAGLAHRIDLAGQEGAGVCAPAIVPVPRAETVPLSFAQQRLWFLDQLEPNSALYNIPAAVRLKGLLDRAVLTRALNEVVRRHEPLRTTFATVEGTPTQVIAAQWELVLPWTDLADVADAERRASVEQMLQEQARTPFDLAVGPLVRTGLIRLADTEHILFVTVHHIVSDGWSWGVLVREVAALYGAFVRGLSSPLPELAVQYADFVHWQRQALSGEGLDRQLAYWSAQLSGAPTLLALPTDRPRGAVQSYRGASSGFEVGPEITAALRALGKRTQSTLFMTLTAALSVLLSRYCGQSDICVGTPIANRNRAEIEPLIGLFVNTLVLRTRVDSTVSVESLLGQVRATALGAYAHQDLPFEQLVDALNPERQLEYAPLFQVMLALQNTPAGPLELPGLTLEAVPTETAVAKFDLTLSVAEASERLSCTLEYNTDLFARSTVERLGGHFVTLLEAMIADPTARIGNLPMLSESERNQLLVDWNGTVTQYAGEAETIHERFEAQAARTPGHVAVVFEGAQLSYRELNGRANRLAHYLRGLGVGPDVRVGLCVERSLDMIVGLLGILKAGGAYVPLDPAYPRDRLAYMLEDARPAVLLTQQRLLESVPTGDTPVVCLDTQWSALAEEFGETAPGNPRNRTLPGNLAYVIYTSGSTGRPKGTLLQHDNVLRLFVATEAWFDFSDRDTWTLFHSYAFDFSVWEIWGALLYGGRLVIVPAPAVRSADQFRDLLAREKVTILNQTPAAFRQLIEVDSPDAPLQLRAVIFGGDALERSRLAPWFETHGYETPLLVNMYGITETTVHVTYCPLREDASAPSSIGRPIPDLGVYLLDRELNVVPVGVAGELHVAGAGLARGYLNRPDLTAERFVPNPFSPWPGGRMYRSGDLARYLPDGNIEYLGRIDDQVKIRGFRVELGEIEAALLSAPAVREALVIARKDGLGENRLVAYVVVADGAPAEPRALRRHLAKRLPEHMVPSAFVKLDALPRSTHGKLDRKALPEPVEWREIGVQAVSRSPTEEALAMIWKELLGVAAVAVDDNFFELGGHSLAATRAMARLRETFNVELPLRALFETPTVRGLAERVEAAWREGAGLMLPPLVRQQRGEAVPLSYAQERLWFLEQLGLVGSAYHMPVELRLDGPIEVAALENSIGDLIRRHESLRTRFERVDGRGVQVIDEPGGFRLEVEDLSGLGTEDQQQEIRRLAAEHAQRPFDLTTGPLLRVKLLRLTDRQHIMLMNLHHIVSDGWSDGVLIRELGALYCARLGVDTASLADLPIQYADYALWQRGWLRGDTLRRQVSYWRERLAGAPAALNLPTDRARPAVQRFRGAIVEFAIPATLTSRLVELSAEEGATLYMVLMAAYALLLGRYSGQDDIVVGSPIAGRQHQDLEGLIGFFVNTLVLRTDLAGNPGFRALLGRVKEAALGAYAHQDLPFEALVEALSPARDLSRQPLFQASFTMNNVPWQPISIPGLELSRLTGEHFTTKFDLSLHLFPEPGLHGHFEYATDLFERSTIERMAGHYQGLLEAIACNPDVPICSLQILTETQRHQIVTEWNRTAASYPDKTGLHELFSAQAARTPAAVALVFEERQLTYAELDRSSNQLAWHLRELGVGPETVVGLCLERSVEMVVGLLGILKAGGAYLPLEPAYPKERIRYMIDDSRASVVVTTSVVATLLMPPAALAVSGVEHGVRVVLLDADGERIGKQPVTAPAAGASSENLAYVIYTSGSTGRPKGAMNTHRALVNRLLWMQSQYGLDPADRVLQKTPFTFDVSVWEFLWPLLHGARLVVARPDGHRDPTYLIDLICREAVTTLHFVPSMLSVFLDSDGIDRCRSLKRVLCSGEALTGEHQERFFKVMSAESLSAELHNLYGPTEAAIDVTCWACVPDGRPTVPIGRPIWNTQVYVLGPDLTPLPVGVAGELYIGGDGLARGYVHRADLTADRFRPSPFADGRRLYRTGDLVRMREGGVLEFLGRLDTQVKIRGYRIELGEIEAALASDSAVKQALVDAREDVPDQKRLVAYVVPRMEALKATIATDGPGLQQEQVAEWAQLFDATYGPGGQAPSFVGWNSSFTGQPIPEEQMWEWLDQTVLCILRHAPERVLEIGCGTGLVLQRLAPRCRAYCGTDISAPALGGLRQWLGTQDGFGHVELARREAAQLWEHSPDAFDTVVLNSVVQYFPDVFYLLDVLERAADRVASGGRIFIGDVRNANLLSVFHTSVQRARATGGGMRVRQLRGAIAGSFEREKELALDPEFFRALLGHHPGARARITAVEILLKRGRSDNELTRYRYDVVLHVGEPVGTPVTDEHITWAGPSSLADLEACLRDRRPPAIQVSGVANRRLARDVAAMRLLETMEDQQELEELEAAVAADPLPAEDPELFWRLGEEHGYEVRIGWTPGSREGRFDVELIDPARARRSEAPPVQRRPWDTYANDLTAPVLRQQLGRRLREMLQARLPDYMIPSAFVMLDRLPLSPNGKIDRKALPSPESQLESRDRVPPSTATEEAVASIWREVLERSQIGIHDNFFELGGHSLLATRVAARLRELLKVEVPLRALFEAPTVQGVAERIETLRWATQEASLDTAAAAGGSEQFEGVI